MYDFEWGYPDYIHYALAIMKGIDADSEECLAALDRPLKWQELRELLLQAEQPQVKYLVAGNPQTSPAVLNYLAQEGDAKIAARVAENANVHESTLAELSIHQSIDVRCAVADSPNVTFKILMELTKDECVEVRYTMSENSNLPEKVLQALAQDENPYVCARAEATLLSLRKADIILGDFAPAKETMQNLRVMRG